MVFLFKRLSLGLLSLLVVFQAEHIGTSFENEVCNGLPSFCRYVVIKRHYEIISEYFIKRDMLKCTNGFDVEMWKQFEQFWKKCREKKPASQANLNLTVMQVYLVWIRATPEWSILNDSFQVFKLIDKNPEESRAAFSLSNLKGFDIDSVMIGDFAYSVVELKNFDFNLYKKNVLVKSCNDFLDEKSLNYSSRQFIFPNGPSRLYIFRPKTIFPVCSLFFRNAYIDEFQIDMMANSFYFKNTIAFTDPDDDFEEIFSNSIIQKATFDQVYTIDVDSKLLNPNVFARIEYFEMKGSLNSIESSVFSPLKRLRTLAFVSNQIFDLIRRTGIEWMKGINVNVNVDVRNRTEFERNQEYITIIKCIPMNINDKSIMKVDKHNDDADFCLFASFPFQQMIFITHHVFVTYESYQAYFVNEHRFTCTELWLFQFYPELVSLGEYHYSNIIDAALNRSNFTACEFEKRIQACNRSQYHVSTTPKEHIYTWFDFIIGFEFSFVIILPVLFSAFSIATNIIVIMVIFHEKNKETMRQKQYIYMSLHCLCNILICSIQFVNLLNECQYPYSGLFCSSVRHLVGIQYLRIIFGEYLNSVLRLVSNFAYFGFSICRLAKIGTSQSQFTVYINEKLRIKRYIICVLFVSAGLSVCKSLQFEINYNYPDSAYPYPFFQDVTKRNWLNESGPIVIFVINILYNSINYFLFVIVHLVVDLVLIKKLWQVMREREEKMREMMKSEKELEKVLKSNEESKRRAVIMVILNSSLNFCLKIPLLITALNDLRLFIRISFLPAAMQRTSFKFLNPLSSPFNLKNFCFLEKSCILFQSFGNCLFLASLSTILFLLKHFDMNFKSAFAIVFHRAENNSRTKVLSGSSVKNTRK